MAGLGCACLLPEHHAIARCISSETSCDKKVEFAKIWISRFFTVLDKNLDEKTRIEIMRQNGEACYAGAYGETMELVPHSYEDIDKSIAEISSYLGKDNPRREGNIIYFQYVGNPNGLKISDGYCLCPMLENGPKTISPTYCQCSVGYVGMMFKKITGRQVKVDLLESLRLGGKTCSFKIMFYI